MDAAFVCPVLAWLLLLSAEECAPAQLLLRRDAHTQLQRRAVHPLQLGAVVGMALVRGVVDGEGADLWPPLSACHDEQGRGKRAQSQQTIW